MDTSVLARKLGQEKLEVAWDALLPHAERDILFVLDRSLDLVDVGVTMAMNQTQAIQEWMEKGQFVRPSNLQKQQWTAENPLFWMLIVQPFVLIQPMTEAERLHVVEQARSNYKA
ncbi:MAG: DUF2288 domain-containing protein [Myxococcota bacterium]